LIRVASSISAASLPRLRAHEDDVDARSTVIGHNLDAIRWFLAKKAAEKEAGSGKTRR
jgi:hypothetical protein